MSAEPIEPSRRRDFKGASPREIRAALIPEEQSEFDRDWKSVIAEATESMELGGVHDMLENWRIHAILTEEHGHAGYRRWLAMVERRSQTGEPAPGSVPWGQFKAELGL